MGEVYRGKDTKLKREVALKILSARFAANPQSLRSFEREAQALAALNHPNIGGIYDLQEHVGINFLVLELIEGETRLEIIKKRSALSIQEALVIASQVCVGLEAAHERGIVHRDLKPA